MRYPPSNPKQAEFAAGQITAISLKDGAKKVLAQELEGPLGLALVDGALYVAEAKPGHISKVDPLSGKKEVLVSSMVGKPVALANDGGDKLLVLDGAGQKIIRICPKTLTMSLIVKDVPVGYSPIGKLPLCGVSFCHDGMCRGKYLFHYGEPRPP